MEEIKSIKEKLQEFLLYVESKDEITVAEVNNKFEEIFNNEYIKEVESVNQAYFQSKTVSYYLKNGNGIVYKESSGDWDRYGDKVSHTGKDIVIASKLARDGDYRQGICLFSESKNQKVKVSKDIDKFFDIDLSKKSLLKNKDNNIYKTLSINVKDSEDIVKFRYEQLKIDAEIEHEDEVQYDLISPYGGLDVEIHSVEELLYESILKFEDDEYFKNRALAMFNNDFNEYLKNQIKECEYAKYIIEHKEDYRKILEIEAEILQQQIPEIDIEEILDNRKVIENKLECLKKEYGMLAEKKYGLFDILLGNKKINDKRMLELYDPQYSSGLINEYEEKLVDNKLEEKEYEEYKEYSDKLENMKKELEKKVDRPFKNFTLNEDYYNVFNNGKYMYIESLEKLEELEDFYTNRLKELNTNLNIAEDYANKIEITKEEINEEILEDSEDMEM